jgi:hypothetical protein
VAETQQLHLVGQANNPAQVQAMQADNFYCCCQQQLVPNQTDVATDAQPTATLQAIHSQ